MKRIYSHPNRMMTYHVKNVLTHAGIDVVMRNDYSGAGAGELPPTDVWPEIWLEDLEQIDKAHQLLDQIITGKETDVSWMCPACHETNGPAFQYCWNCQSEKPL